MRAYANKFGTILFWAFTIPFVLLILVNVIGFLLLLLGVPNVYCALNAGCLRAT